MFIKPKSLIVVILSSVVISSVLIFTLIGYYMYIELKERDVEKACSDSIKKMQARIFSKHIEISQLSCEMGTSGPLKGKAVISGVVKNSSGRRLASIVIKVKFLDTEGASMYEVMSQPLEPTFGLDQLGSLTRAYLAPSQRNFLEPNSSRAFKRIIPNCPQEILRTLAPSRKGKKSATKRRSQWSGQLTAEVMSVSL
jgi:hypothetical protein